MTMRNILVLIAALLAGCASIDATIQQKYLGRHVDEAIRSYGYPTQERHVAGRKVYSWQVQNSMMVPNYTTSTTTGTVGRYPVYGTTQQYGAPTIHQMSCQLDLEVDGAEIVSNYSWAGHLGACGLFAR